MLSAPNWRRFGAGSARTLRSDVLCEKLHLVTLRVDQVLISHFLVPCIQPSWLAWLADG